MSFEEADKLYPKPDFSNPYEPYRETGESDWQAFARASAAVEKVISRGPGSYLVVAHGGILNAAFKTIVGATPSANKQGIVFALGDTGYARFPCFPKKHLWVLFGFDRGF